MRGCASRALPCAGFSMTHIAGRYSAMSSSVRRISCSVRPSASLRVCREASSLREGRAGYAGPDHVRRLVHREVVRQDVPLGRTVAGGQFVVDFECGDFPVAVFCCPSERFRPREQRTIPRDASFPAPRGFRSSRRRVALLPPLLEPSRLRSPGGGLGRRVGVLGHESISRPESRI